MNIQYTLKSVLHIVALVGLLTGCEGTPDEVRYVDGPGNGITYVIETSDGGGAAVGSDTSVYATMPKANGVRRILVLSGTNLSIKKLGWIDRNSTLICLTGGITTTYRSEITIGEEGKTLNVRNHLTENC